MDSAVFKEHPIQSIVSRTGSFPLRVAYESLKEWGEKDSVVLDPFCGKGTTLFAARMLGYSAYGLDVAPEAVVCASSKMLDIKLSDTIQYVSDLSTDYNDGEQIPPEVKVFYSDYTLSQILSIKHQLLSDLRTNKSNTWNKALLATAAMLGILHGHASYSLSVPCAHAYAMAPSYVSRYTAEHGLIKPDKDVKQCLSRKIERCLKYPLPDPVPSSVKIGSVFDCLKIFPKLENAVDIVFTSPPYLNSQTYAKDNWLRHWFLSYDYRNIQHEYLATNSISRYSELMLKAFMNIVKLLKVGGYFICIAGDVNLRRSRNGEIVVDTFETGDFLADLCESTTLGLKIVSEEEHIVSSHSRYLHSLSKSNGHGKKDITERMFVAVKV